MSVVISEFLGVKIMTRNHTDLWQPCIQHTCVSTEKRSHTDTVSGSREQYPEASVLLLFCGRVGGRMDVWFEGC